MITVNVVVDRSDIEAEITPAARRAVLAGTRRVRDRVAKRLEPHPVARAVEASVSEAGGQVTGRITSQRGGPGIIRPVRAQALRFVPKSGGVVFAMSVNSPGIAPLIRAEALRATSQEFNP